MTTRYDGDTTDKATANTTGQRRGTSDGVNRTRPRPIAAMGQDSPQLIQFALRKVGGLASGW